MAEGRLLLGELTFHLNGKQAYVLIQTAADGTKKLVIREGLMNVLEDMARVGKRLQGQSLPGGSSAEQGTVPVPNVLAALRESLGFFSREAGELYGDRPLPGRNLFRQGQSLKSILLTPEVIRKNYGITRSMSVLAAMGYKIFVREDASMKDEKARESFYRQYHLEGFLESGTLAGVSGNDAEVRQQMEKVSKKRLTRENAIMVSFRNETQGEAPFDFAQLLLDEEVLGYSANRRADYPVLLMASRLLEDPNALLWKQLGEGVIGNLSGYIWMLHQTPGSLDLSEDLIQELMNYHAAHESIKRAA